VFSRNVTRAASGFANFANMAPHLIAGERHYARIAKGFDRDATEAIIRRFGEVPEFRDGRKYLKIGLYLRDSVARAVALGLHRHAPIRLLDLGSGAGYFLLACRHFGHDVIGYDLPGNGFYQAMFQHFGLSRIEGAIMPLTGVGGLQGQFDLITAFSVTFSKIRKPGGTEDWGQREWLFFFSDMRRWLRPGGRLFLRLNLLQVSGIRSREEYAFLHAPIPGFEVRILNRREVCLTAI